MSVLSALGDWLSVLERALAALVLDRVVDPDAGATDLAEAFYSHTLWGSFTRSRRPRRFATLGKRDEVHQDKRIDRYLVRVLCGYCGRRSHANS